MNSANMYAGILIVSALGYTLNRLFVVLETKTMKSRRGMIAREAA
jgi:ABC-type nitrate/sulfonate/bicarbonate transport system permease component